MSKELNLNAKNLSPFIAKYMFSHICFSILTAKKKKKKGRKRKKKSKAKKRKEILLVFGERP